MHWEPSSPPGAESLPRCRPRYVSPEGKIAIPDTPGRGYEIRTDLVDRLTVRKETIRETALVA
jgi:hypothetical protein